MKHSEHHVYKKARPLACRPRPCPPSPLPPNPPRAQPHPAFSALCVLPAPFAIVLLSYSIFAACADPHVYLDL
eukprot:4606813-Pleurochrysis_carterae.AAC.1